VLQDDQTVRIASPEIKSPREFIIRKSHPVADVNILSNQSILPYNIEKTDIFEDSDVEDEIVAEKTPRSSKINYNMGKSSGKISIS
jgi:hypothetical protein